MKYLSQTLIGIVLSLVLGAGMVSAQGIKSSSGPLDNVAGKAGVTDQGDLGAITGTTINAMLQLVGLLFMVLTVYAGILWMTARGNEDQVQKAQKIITASLIGLIITISAYAITVFVTGRFES